MRCLCCNKEFEPNNGQGGFTKKFCDSRCRTRYNSKVRYERNKNNPVDAEKRKKCFKRWYERNKDRQKIKMRFYMRDYYQKKYSKRAKENAKIQEETNNN